MSQAWQEEEARTERVLSPWAVAGFVVFLIALVFFEVVALVPVLEEGWPVSVEATYSTEASLFRCLHRFIVGLPAGFIIFSIFAYTFRMPLRFWLKHGAVLSLMMSAGWSLDIWHSRERRTLASSLMGTAGIYLAGFSGAFYPLLFVNKFPKRGEADEENAGKEKMRKVHIFGIMTAALWSSSGEWDETVGNVMLVFFAVSVIILVTWALVRDRAVVLSPWYTAFLSTATTTIPIFMGNVIRGLFDAFDQTTVMGAVGTTLVLGGLVTWLHQVVKALGRHGLPARHSAIAFFSLLVLEDFFVEFVYTAGEVFGATYFALLMLQLMRTIGRNGGVYGDILIFVRRRILGDKDAKREPADVVDLARVWQLNMFSEVCSLAGLLGILAGEEIQGGLGSITGLPSSRRGELAAGYVVVAVADSLAHALAYRLLQNKIAIAQAQLAAEATPVTAIRRGTIVALGDDQFSLGTERGKIILRHGVLLVSSLVYFVGFGSYYFRLIAVDAQRE